MQKKNRLKRHTHFLVLLLVLFSLSSCVNFDKIEVQEIRSVKVIEVSNNGILLEAELKINNPNPYVVAVTGSELKLSLRDVKVGNASLKNKLKLKNKVSQYYIVQIEGDFDDLKSSPITGFLGIFSARKSANFGIDGHVAGRVFLVKHKIDVSYHGEIPLEF